MCQTSQVAMKKRSRDGAANVEAVTKRAKQIVLTEDQSPKSPVDVASEFDDASVSSDASVELEDLAPTAQESKCIGDDLNLEVKLMQGAVNEMQATVNLAASRISELRALLEQYAECR